jgi:hypothetical protein
MQKLFVMRLSLSVPPDLEPNFRHGFVQLLACSWLCHL